MAINGRKFRNVPRSKEQGPPTTEGLPVLVNGNNYGDPQAPLQGEGPPVLSRNNGGGGVSEGLPQMASLHKSRRSRTLRKKN